MKSFWISLKYLFLMTLITGLIYPLLVTALGRVFFPNQAQGSLIHQENQIIGSELIGQNFKELKYFWSRPSAIDYNPILSGGSNLGPSSADLLKKFKERRQVLATFSPNPPQELLFASASGLDPHISPMAAHYQIDRIAKQRGFSAQQSQELSNLIDRMTEDRDFGILGEKRVNVLKLNLAMDQQWK